MSEVERAYMGAFLDGEGSIWEAPQGCWQIAIFNTEPEYHSAFLRATGTGMVYFRASSSNSGLPQFVWKLLRQLEVHEFIQQIRAYSTKAQCIAERLERSIVK